MTFTIQNTSVGSRLAHDGEKRLVYNCSKINSIPIVQPPSVLTSGYTPIYNSTLNKWVWGDTSINPVDTGGPDFIQKIYKEERNQIERANATGWAQIDPSFEVSITPAETTSKILFECNLHIGVDDNYPFSWGVKLYRKGQGESVFSEVTGATGDPSKANSTILPVGVFLSDTHGANLTDDSYYLTNVKSMYLDEPTIANTTDPIVYTLYWAGHIHETSPQSSTIRLNRTASITEPKIPAPISTMTVTEIYNGQINNSISRT